MAAAQYVDVPGYSALLLRRSFPDLNQPDAMIPRSKEWWHGKAHWNGQEKRWTFPSGATISFGYLEHEDDVMQYQGAAFHFCGIDELTQHVERNYLYLSSRLRKPADGPLAKVPLRLRAASNPGSKGHDWVRKRFIPSAFLTADEETQFSRPWYVEDRFFIPARLEDNPSLNIVEYDRQLAVLDPVTRAQLRKGDWKAHAGGRFRAEWWRRYRLDLDVLRLDDGTFVILSDVPRVVIVDPANRKTKASKYTAIGVYGDLGRQRIACLDMVREQLSIEEIVPAIARVCRRWNPEVCGIEANGFQIAIVAEARNNRGIPTVIELEPAGKSKLTRNTPAILRAEQSGFYLPEQASWLEDFEHEHQQFTGDEKEDAYTDQVDVSGYSVSYFDHYATGDGEPMILGTHAQRQVGRY